MHDNSAIERAANQPAKEDQLRFLLNVVARRWKWILVCTMLGSIGYGIVGLLTYKNTTLYSSSTQLIVHQPIGERVPGVSGPPLVKNSPQAIVERVTLNDLAEDVVRALVVQDVDQGGRYGSLTSATEIGRAANTLLSQYRINIQPVETTDKIIVIATGPDQEEVFRIVDLTARAFIERNRQFLLDQEQEIHDFIMDEIEKTRVELDSSETSVWQFRKAMGFRTQDQVTSDMETMSAQLIEARKTRTELMAKMDRIQEEILKKQSELPQSLDTINDGVMNKLFNELHDLHRERLTLSVNWTESYPPLRAIEDQLRDKEQAILQAYAELEAGQGGSDVWQDRQSLRKQYMDLQLQLTALDIKTSTYRKLLDEMEGQLPELTAKNKEYLTLKREAEHLRDQYKVLIDKEFEVSSAIRRGAGYVERLTPVEAAELATGQVVQAWMNFLIGGLVGLAAGLGLAMMWEKADSSIHTAEDVSHYLGLEVIGMIPMMRFGSGTKRKGGNFVSVDANHEMDACIVTKNDPKSPISEAYRSLRTAFQLNTFTTQPKTVMVTSTVPGEGKTTTAVNMAVTFANSGMRVLLIDTDLRRPHAHHVLKIDREPGLADVLSKGMDPMSVIRETGVNNLRAISSGRVPPNPSELIGSDSMRRMMDDLRDHFDVIICDAPSLLVVTDPVVLSTGVDAVIMVVSVNNARRETIMRGKKLLETAQANIIGVVLNGLEASRRNYYYYYYYYDDNAPGSKRSWFHFQT